MSETLTAPNVKVLAVQLETDPTCMTGVGGLKEKASLRFASERGPIFLEKHR